MVGVYQDPEAREENKEINNPTETKSSNFTQAKSTKESQAQTQRKERDHPMYTGVETERQLHKTIVGGLER